MATQQAALIVGAGPGLSASLARLLAREGFSVGLAARDTAKLAPLLAETGARAYACDTGDAKAVASLFAQVEAELGAPALVVFNAGARYRAGIEALDAAELEAAIRVGALGGAFVAHEAATRMLAAGSGTILLTGATASLSGHAGSIPFAMAKFALRGLAQSLARELAPRGVHVAHVVIDGGIAAAHRPGREPEPGDRWLDPDAIAGEYLHLHRQHRSAWTWELELRPWVERF